VIRRFYFFIFMCHTLRTHAPKIMDVTRTGDVSQEVLLDKGQSDCFSKGVTPSFSCSAK